MAYTVGIFGFSKLELDYTEWHYLLSESFGELLLWSVFFLVLIYSCDFSNFIEVCRTDLSKNLWVDSGTYSHV